MLAALLLAIATASPAVERELHEDGVLVLGRVSDNPRDHYAQLRPLLDYVVPRLRGVGIREGRVLMARDAQQMLSYMRRGRVDWITETAGTGMAFSERANARVLVATERSGVRQYHSVFFARRDSGIRSVQDLRGRSLALQNPSSTSAYFAPALSLLDAGLDMEILLSPQDRPAGDSVGYLFARSEGNIATWVHKRLVDAGAFSNLDWHGLERLPQSFRDDLVLFHETPPFPRAIELVRGDLDPAVAQRLRQVLLAAAEDPDARVPMLHFFNTTRFVPVDGDTERSLQALADGVERIRRLLE
jgi:phosphonate transport system substrate-binding protein